MKLSETRITVTQDSINAVLGERDGGLVRLSLSVPVFATGSARADRRINAFYGRCARTLRRYAETRLLRMARDAESALSGSRRAFRPYEVTMTFGGVYISDEYISLYRDVSYSFGGNDLARVRCGDTWDAKTGWPVGLREFFPKGARIGKLLAENALHECASLGLYGGISEKRLRRNLDRRLFFLFDGAIRYFFAPGSIAPVEKGVIVFDYYTEIEKRR